MACQDAQGMRHCTGYCSSQVRVGGREGGEGGEGREGERDG